jgi:hypothetical protein
MNKTELIKNIVESGRAQDLLLMLEGESPYTNDESEGAPKDHALAKLWTAALYHLRFIAEFGNQQNTLMKDGKWVSAFPEEFSQWLEAGAPGIAIEEIVRYVKENPL